MGIETDRHIRIGRLTAGKVGWWIAGSLSLHVLFLSGSWLVVKEFFSGPRSLSSTTFDIQPLPDPEQSFLRPSETSLEGAAQTKPESKQSSRRPLMRSRPVRRRAQTGPVRPVRHEKLRPQAQATLQALYRPDPRPRARGASSLDPAGSTSPRKIAATRSMGRRSGDGGPIRPQTARSSVRAAPGAAVSTARPTHGRGSGRIGPRAALSRPDRGRVAARIRQAVAKVLIYPIRARRLEMQGEVVVSFYIDEAGHAVRVRILRSGGALLDRAAVGAIHRAEPLPKFPDEVRIPVRFHLDD